MSGTKAQYVLNCPRCSELILKGTESDIKIRSRVLLLKGINEAYAVCKGCGDEVSVPLQLELSVVKSLPLSTNPRLFISKSNK